MNLTILILLCIAITLALVIFPLIVSYKAEKSKKQAKLQQLQNELEKLNSEFQKKLDEV